MKSTLAELEQIAVDLSIKVSYEDLKTSKGGSCRVMETRRIIINKHLRPSEKITLLARELGNFDLTGLDIPDRIRRKIEHEADQELSVSKKNRTSLKRIV
ncbi:MAG: ImmA/IrrE family metallo-endopeptidase [Nitrospirota bacterium]